MKRFLCFLLAAAMLLSLTACKKEETGFYQSPEDITAYSIFTMTSPNTMVSREGAVKVSLESDAGNTSTLLFQYDGEYYHANQISTYASGDTALMYFNSIPEDAYFYAKENGKVAVQVMTDGSKEGILYKSVLNIANYNCEIGEVTQEDGKYVATMGVLDDELLVQVIKLWMEPEYGYVEKAERTYYEGETVTANETITFEYLKEVEIDTSPKDDATEEDLPENWYLAASEATVETDVEDYILNRTGDFTFATTELDGDNINFNSLGESQIYLIYFFDPTVEDCAQQMGLLQDLYTSYGKENINIVAVMCPEGDKEAAEKAVYLAGATYPVVNYTSWLAVYAPREYPGAIVVNKNADLVTEEPYIGSYTYNEWETFAQSYLNAD